IGGYPVHANASLFPPLGGDAYQEVKKSIAHVRQPEPIICKDGVLIDRRKRLKGFLDFGRQPGPPGDNNKLFVEEFILVKNLFRRHLTDDQRMMITAQALLAKETEAAKARQHEAGRSHGKSRPKVAANSTQAIREPTVTEKIAEAAHGSDYAAR